MMYNKTVQNYFFFPLHVGRIDLNEGFIACVKQAQKGQGCTEFYIQCGRDHQIQRACFKTNGNPYLIASLEWLCRRVEGQLLEQAAQVKYQMLIEELEIPVPQYPIALKVLAIFKEVFILMTNKLSQNHHT